MPSRRSWGTTKQMRSGRYQASYVGPDKQRHLCNWTFSDKDAASLWLRDERKAIEDGTWTPPKLRAATTAHDLFAGYARAWVDTRRTKKGPIKPRTRAEYLRLLDILNDTFGSTPVRYISPGMVDDWWGKLPKDNPTQNARLYSLLRSILNTAVERRLIDRNPCMIRGAGNVDRKSTTEPATLDELAVIVEEIPDRYKAMVLLAAWCQLRFGELTELRRSDLDLAKGIVKVKRGVTWVKLEDDDEDEQTAPVVGDPKSTAGQRNVSIPPHIIPALRDHLRQMPMTGRDALLFPSKSDPTAHMRPSTLTNVYYRARRKAGRPDLRFHDLRHTGATYAAYTGATLAELMLRIGHSTPGAAMRYQHAVSTRDAKIAAALSEIAAQ